MIRRLTFAAVFAAVALSSTGCCGTFRNFVYRVRHCGDCYPPCSGCAGGPVVSPSYAVPLADAGHGPIMGAAPGCASCAGTPTMPSYPVGGVPMAPGYGPQPGYVVQPGPVGGMTNGGQMAGNK